MMIYDRGWYVVVFEKKINTKILHSDLVAKYISGISSTTQKPLSLFFLIFQSAVPSSMEHFRTSISNQVKSLTPLQLEVERRIQSQISELNRSNKFEVERSIVRQSMLESRIRRLERKNSHLRKELSKHRAGATADHVIIAQLQSEDEELRKLREEVEKLREENMGWEKRCNHESEEAAMRMVSKLVEAGEKIKLASEKEAGTERRWNRAAAVLKMTANFACCNQADDGGGGDEVMAFGADSMMMLEPFLESLKTIEGCIREMELQTKGLRQATELLSGELEEDGFVDVGALIEAEKALDGCL